jgi:hypothetical protein
MLDLIARNPGASRTMLHGKNPKLYSKLKKEDRAWFDDQMPPPIKPAHKPYSVTAPEWDKRDEEFEILVRKRAEELYSIEKPVWVNKTKLLEALPLDFDTITNELDGLLNTKKALEETIETSKQWALRRIDWAVKQFIEIKTMPTPYKLSKTAGVHNRMDDPDIQVAIDNSMELLKQQLSL